MELLVLVKNVGQEPFPAGNHLKNDFSVNIVQKDRCGYGCKVKGILRAIAFLKRPHLFACFNVMLNMIAVLVYQHILAKGRYGAVGNKLFAAIVIAG